MYEMENKLRLKIHLDYVYVLTLLIDEIKNWMCSKVKIKLHEQCISIENFSNYSFFFLYSWFVEVVLSAKSIYENAPKQITY